MPSAMKASRQLIAVAFRYGSLVVLIAAVLNVYFVMRYIELSRNSTKIEDVFTKNATQYQALQNVLREFVGRASTDSAILGILQRAQQSNVAAAQPGATGSAPPSVAPAPPKASFP